MESSPPPMPFEYGESKDDKSEKKDKKKSTHIRVPLPASEVHKPKSFERLLPLFEKNDDVSAKVDKDTTGMPKRTVPEQSDTTQTQDNGEATTEQAPHRDLEDVHDALWTEFENTEPAAHEPTDEERNAGMFITPRTAVPELRAPDDVPTSPEHRPHGDKGELNMPAPEPQNHWTEEHTVHLNEKTESGHTPVKPEDAMPAAPSAAGMAAEVAATEPDQDALRMWEEFNNAPRTNAPEWHPESKPLSTNEQFQDMMQRADMGEQFIESSSDTPAEVPAPKQPAHSYGTYNTYAPLTQNTAEAVPDTPPPYIPANTGTVPHATGGEAPEWHTPRRPHASQNTTGSMLRHAAEAGAVGGVLAGAGAAHAAGAAESGGALAGGLVAGAAAGAAAGEYHGRQQAAENAREQAIRDQQRIQELTNEQQADRSRIDQLTEQNQRLSAEHQSFAARQPFQGEAPAVAAATAVPVAESLQNREDQQGTPDTKVVHSEWVDMTVDRHNGQLAEGPGVNEFGKEFRNEQSVETQPPADPLAIALAAAKAAARTAADVTDTYEQEHGQPMQNAYSPQLPSGQAALSHELAPGHTPLDVQHRLPEPRSAFKEALSNPLIWAGGAILILAFMAAAFI